MSKKYTQTDVKKYQRELDEEIKLNGNSKRAAFLQATLNIAKKEVKEQMNKYIVYMNNSTSRVFDSELEMYKWLYEESWEEEGRVIAYGEVE